MVSDEKRVRLQFKDVVKNYGDGKKKICVVDNISFDVYDNEFLVILGPEELSGNICLKI